MFEDIFFGGKEPGIAGSEKNYSAYVLLYEREDFLEALETTTCPATLLTSSAQGASGLAQDTPAAGAVSAGAAGRPASQGSNSSSGSMSALAARVSALTMQPGEGQALLRDAVPPSIHAAVALANTEFNFACHLYDDSYAAMLARMGTLTAQGLARGEILDDEACAAVARLLARAYLRLYVHLRQRANAIPVRRALLALLKCSAAARAHVCCYLTEESGLLRACLLKCRADDVRQDTADVVLAALIGVAVPDADAPLPLAVAAGDVSDAGGGMASSPSRRDLKQQLLLLREMGAMLLTEGAEHIARGVVLTRLLARYIAHGPVQRATAVEAGLDVQLLRFLQLETSDGGRRWTGHQLEMFTFIHQALSDIVRSSDVSAYLGAAIWHAVSSDATDAAAAVDAVHSAADSELALARDAHSAGPNPHAVARPEGEAPLTLSLELAEGLFMNGAWARDLLTTLLAIDSTAPLLRFLIWCNPAFSHLALCVLLEDLPRRTNYRVTLSALQDIMLQPDVLQAQRVQVSHVGTEESEMKKAENIDGKGKRYVICALLTSDRIGSLWLLFFFYLMLLVCLAGRWYPHQWAADTAVRQSGCRPQASVPVL